MKNLILLLALVTLLFNCNSNDNKKIISKENETQNIKKDTSLIEIADLPIHIDSTDYLLHPIGNYKIYASKLSSYRSDNYNSFSVSNSNKYSISGNLSNIKFQKKDSEELIPLTNKIINIKSMSFMKEIFDTTKSQLLIYTINDKDTNSDNKLDYNDIETLYISKIDGSGFKKLTPEYEELLDWETVIIINRIYFKTIEDSNKNGEFDKSDSLHYYFIDYSKESYVVKEYYPI